MKARLSPGSRGMMGKGKFFLMVSESVMMMQCVDHCVLINCCLSFDNQYSLNMAV